MNNSITNLINYVLKQPQETLSYTETSATPTPTGDIAPSPKISADIVPQMPKTDDGGHLVPAQDRVYLVDGFLPGDDANPKTPEDLGLFPYKGIDDENARFVDKRQIHSRHKNLLENIHPAKHTNRSFGGIVMNDDGEILLRKPKGTGFGNRWTLPKGGANKGEEPEEAALREVLEETGIKGSILSEVPGHYNADDKSNKFFVMTVEEDTGSFFAHSNDETAELKWVPLKDAMTLLEEEYSGKSVEKADRDIQAIRAGHREWTAHNKNKDMFAGVLQAAQRETSTLKLQRELTDHYAAHGEFPDLNDIKYASFLHDLGKEFTYPGEHGTESYKQLKTLTFDILRKIDIQRKHNTGSDYPFGSLSEMYKGFIEDWAVDSLRSSLKTNMFAHALAELREYPESYMYGHEIPPDVDLAGRRIFRSDALRDEMIDAYSEWEQGSSDGKGQFLENGETYNFNDQKDRGLMTTIYVNVAGKRVPRQVESWEHVIETAKATNKVKEVIKQSTKMTNEDVSYRMAGIGHGVAHPEENLKYGAKFGDENDKKLLAAGKKFVAEAATTTYQITQSLLKAVFESNGVHHVYTWRIFNSPREALGGNGIQGTGEVSRAQMQQMGMPTVANEKPGQPGLAANMNSRSISGGSLHPAWGDPPGAIPLQSYHAVQRTNIKDIVSFNTTAGDLLNNEREAIFLTNPDIESRIFAYKGNTMKGGDTWRRAEEANGFTMKNMFGGGRRRGVTDPDSDYSTLLTKATGKDLSFLTGKKGDTKLGTNPGGVYRDKSGQLFYMKEDTHTGQNVAEDLANQLYRAAGIGVPNTAIVPWGEHGTILKSDWLEDATYHQPTDASGNYIEDGMGVNDGTFGNPSPALANRPEIKHGFLVDCVLANWDVAGAGPEKRYGNLAEKDGKLIRLDQGGALNFTGTGKDKPSFFTGHKNAQNGYIDEIDRLRNPSGNPTAAHIFQNMSEDDWNTSAENLMRLTNGRVEDIVNDSALAGHHKDEMIETLINRRDKALQWWIDNPKIVGKTGYTSIDDLHAKRNILRKTVLKEDSSELYAEKHPPMLWIDEEGKNKERLPRTAEDKAISDKHYDYVTKLKQKVLQRLLESKND